MEALFALNFTLQHCVELMQRVHVGRGYKKPTHLGAKIWALADVLTNEHHRLMTCRPHEAAALAGHYFGHAMTSRPLNVRSTAAYLEAHEVLEKNVQLAIAARKYGPNYA